MSIAPSRRAGPAATSRHARRPLSLLIAIGLGVVVALAGVAAARPDGWTRITVLDVGQGDAILIEGSSGGRVLIDGGPDPDRLVTLLDARLPTWDRRIDLVILSHPHEDHAAGLVGLLARYRIGRFVEPGMRGPGPGYVALTGILGERGPRPGRLGTGDRFTVDEERFVVLWPDRGSVPESPPRGGKAINNVSIVLEMSVGQRRFLLMGDAEEEIDPVLLRRGLRHADVLKVAHHGSRTATTAPFLSAVRPVLAIISVGAENSYGHPSPDTVARLQRAGARVLRTDRDGSVTVATDGRRLRLSTRRETATPGDAGHQAALGHLPTGPPAPTDLFGELVYDPADGRPGARRGRLRSPAARSARVVPAPLARGRRGRRLPRLARPGPGPPRRRPVGRGCGAVA